jgi:hypothetical protein
VTQHSPPLYRPAAVLLALALWAAPLCLPPSAPWMSAAAFAESGKGKEGDGGGNGGSGHEGRESHDDHDDDRGGDDTQERESGREGGQGSGRAQEDLSGEVAGQKSNTPARDPSPGNPRFVLQRLHLRYANGWDERVAGGRYRLTDPKGQVVTDRVARPEDLERMRAASLK